MSMCSLASKLKNGCIGNVSPMPPIIDFMGLQPKEIAGASGEYDVLQSRLTEDVILLKFSSSNESFECCTACENCPQVY